MRRVWPARSKTHGYVRARSVWGHGQKPARGAEGAITRKAAPSCAQRALGAFVLLQDGEANENGARPDDLLKNAPIIKAAVSYFWASMPLGFTMS